MKTTYTSLFLLLAIISYAQTSIEGTILDENKQSIPYANIVIMNTGIGVLSKGDGSFSLAVPDSFLLDTLEVSYLGYDSQYFGIHTLAGNANIIELEKSEIELVEIIVHSKKAKYIEKGSNDKKADTGIGKRYDNLDNIFIIAKYIDNDKKEKGFIQSVSFYIRKSLHLKKGHQTPFRIRLYDMGEDGNPGENILLDNAITQANKKNKWHTLDISQYNIPIPENGFFVGMEWLISEDEKYKKEVKINYVKEDGTKEKRKEIAFGQGLGLVEKEYLESIKSKTWIAHGDKWQQGFCLRRTSEKTGKFLCHEAMIKAALEIYP
jgi:hypothetical protein